MKILEVVTETGSVYHITPDLSTWAIVTRGELVGPFPLRTEMDKFNAWSGARVGEPMVFHSKGINFGSRLIQTSPVMKVTEIERD